MKRYAAIGPLVVILLWIVLHYSGFVRPLWLPSPWKTLIATSRMVVTLDGLVTILWTLVRILVGYALSVMIGIPLGLLMGRFRRIGLSVSSIVDFLRSLPALALFPLLMLVFGIGEASKIATTVLSCSLVLIVHAMYGVQAAAPERLVAAELMSASRIEIFTKVILWEALPSIAMGMRIALSLAVVVIIVTEMFISTSVGLGYRIYQDHLTYRIPEMYAAILMTGFVGLGLNILFNRIEKRVLHWIAR